MIAGPRPSSVAKNLSVAGKAASGQDGGLPPPPLPLFPCAKAGVVSANVSPITPIAATKRLILIFYLLARVSRGWRLALEPLPDQGVA